MPTIATSDLTTYQQIYCLTLASKKANKTIQSCQAFICKRFNDFDAAIRANVYQKFYNKYKDWPLAAQLRDPRTYVSFIIGQNLEFSPHEKLDYIDQYQKAIEYKHSIAAEFLSQFAKLSPLEQEHIRCECANHPEATFLQIMEKRAKHHFVAIDEVCFNIYCQVLSSPSTQSPQLVLDHLNAMQDAEKRVFLQKVLGVEPNRVEEFLNSQELLEDLIDSSNFFKEEKVRKILRKFPHRILRSKIPFDLLRPNDDISAKIFWIDITKGFIMGSHDIQSNFFLYTPKKQESIQQLYTATFRTKKKVGEEIGYDADSRLFFIVKIRQEIEGYIASFKSLIASNLPQEFGLHELAKEIKARTPSEQRVILHQVFNIDKETVEQILNIPDPFIMQRELLQAKVSNDQSFFVPNTTNFSPAAYEFFMNS